jgi:hypothetical protein
VSDGSGVRQPGCIVETANGRLGYVAYDYICKMPNTEQVELQPKYGCCDTGPDSGDLVCTVRANQWGGLSKIRAAGLGLSPVKLDRRAIADLVNVFKGDLNFHEALAGLTLVKYVLDPSFRAETNSIRQELQAIAQNKNLPVDKRGNVAYVLLHYPNLSEQEEASFFGIYFEMEPIFDEAAIPMIKKAKELYLDNTHFAEPIGLLDREDYTTSIELARLTSYALENPEFAKIVATKIKTITTESGNKYTFPNINIMLNYPGVNGVKTGYTEGAGQVLVTSQKINNGKDLIFVVMQSQDRFRDTEYLLNYLNNNITFLSSRP